MMPSVTPSLKAINAIAQDLLEPFGETDDRFHDATDAAFSSIVYDDSVLRGMLKDPRFYVPNDPKIRMDVRGAAGNPNDPLNVLDPKDYFAMGFDLALALTARIVAEPLVDHNISDLIDAARAQLLEDIKKHRDKYLPTWEERLMLARVAAASAKQPVVTPA